MQLAFGWYNIIELLFCLVALWMGIRDLQGKDPLIHTCLLYTSPSPRDA